MGALDDFASRDRDPHSVIVVRNSVEPGFVLLPLLHRFPIVYIAFSEINRSLKPPYSSSITDRRVSFVVFQLFHQLEWQFFLTVP